MKKVRKAERLSVSNVMPNHAARPLHKWPHSHVCLGCFASALLKRVEGGCCTTEANGRVANAGGHSPVQNGPRGLSQYATRVTPVSSETGSLPCVLCGLQMPVRGLWRCCNACTQLATICGAQRVHIPVAETLCLMRVVQRSRQRDINATRQVLQEEGPSVVLQSRQLRVRLSHLLPSCPSLLPTPHHSHVQHTTHALEKSR